MASTRFTLKKHSKELVDLFYSIIEKQDENYIWTNEELVDEINKILAKKKGLTNRQIGWIIRWQKKYLPFKYRGVTSKYIFKPSKIGERINQRNQRR